MKSKEKVRLSTQELLECDVGNNGCAGGNVNKVLNFGATKGFNLEECMESQPDIAECEVDHFDNNDCRVSD